MKTATYNTKDGPIHIEYDENAPCWMCDKPVVGASMSGTVICCWCDMGRNRDGSPLTWSVLRMYYENYRTKKKVYELGPPCKYTIESEELTSERLRMY